MDVVVKQYEVYWISLDPTQSSEFCSVSYVIFISRSELRFEIIHYYSESVKN